MNDPNTPSLDALADAVAQRLSARMSLGPIGPRGPTGEPDPALPLLPPWGQLDDSIPALFAGARLAIAGVEYTQSTQYNAITTTFHESDNSVPLVAYKQLVARVYPTVRRGQFGADTLSGQYVTGELVLSIGDRVIYQTGPTRASGARVGPTTKIDRGLWDREYTLFGNSGIGGTFTQQGNIEVNCPLNFVVPAYYCRLGRVHITVRLWPVANGAMSSRRAARTEYLQFIDVQAPKICLVRVNWTDSAGNVFKPSDDQMLATLSLAERMMPFPYFETIILNSEISSSAPFAMAATNGGCNNAWSKLVAELDVTRIFTALFQLGDIVYGMVPQAAIPAGAGAINTGCGKGAGGGFVSDPTTFAHELGHLYGRPHVSVPGDPNNDTAYPKYGGSATTIGEVGIDTGTSTPTLFDPSSSNDIMSYNGNQWISPYTYQKILDARGMHQSKRVDPRRLRPVLMMSFRLYRQRGDAVRVEIKSAAHVAAPGRAPGPTGAAVSPVSIDFLDANRRILATHHCFYAAARGSSCGCHSGEVPLDREPWLDFTEAIEWPGDDVAAITFHRGGDPVHTVNLGEAPSVSISGPDRQEQNLTVTITVTHPRERVSVVVLFSGDDGATWQPIALDPPDGIVQIETNRLPGGERCLFRAIGTAELQSTTADTDPFQLPRMPRRLYVITPSGECGTPAGPVTLSACIDTRGLGPVTPQDIRWTSNLDGDLGHGYTITPHLNEGRHEVTAAAPDGLGGVLSERGIIIVGGRSG